jgi:hypothetical protein
MNTPQPEPAGFDSPDWTILEFDGPADNTVKPCPPEVLPYALAERERLVQAGLLPPLPGAKSEIGQVDANPPGESVPNKPHPEPLGLSSSDCTILEFDGPGDTTVRPCRPELLPILLAERERYVQAGLLPPWPGTQGKKEQPDATSSGEKQE